MFDKLSRTLVVITATALTLTLSGTVLAKTTEGDVSLSSSQISSSMTSSSSLATTAFTHQSLGTVCYVDSEGQQIGSSQAIIYLDNGLILMPNLNIPGRSIEKISVGNSILSETSSSFDNLALISGKTISKQQLNSVLGDNNDLSSGITIQYSNLSKNTVTVHFVNDQGNSLGIPDESYTGVPSDSSFIIRTPEVPGYQPNGDTVEINFNSSHVVTVVYSSTKAASYDDEASVASSGATNSSTSSSQGSSVNGTSNISLSSIQSSQSSSQETSSVIGSSDEGVTTNNQQQSSVVNSNKNEGSKQTMVEKQSQPQTAQRQSSSVQSTVLLPSKSLVSSSILTSTNFSSASQVSSTRTKIVNGVMKTSGAAESVSSKVSKVSGADVVHETARQLPDIKSLTASAAGLSAIGFGIWWLRKR